MSFFIAIATNLPLGVLVRSSGTFSVSIPAIPIAPIARTPEVISPTTIRWYFLDQSNNEFGFKILDSSLKEVAQSDAADVSYIDETGLQPNTEYSGRLVVAFNDRGTSLTTVFSNFEAARTLAKPKIEEEAEEAEPQTEEEPAEEPAEEPQEEGITAEGLRGQIQSLQLRLIELLNQLIEILQEQLAIVSNFLAGLWITLF